MIVKPQPYILAPQNITANDLELVGREGILQSFIHQQGLPTPKSFIVTSKVFDDFLSSGELIDKITQVLSNVDIKEELSLNKAYREIDKLIKETPLPSTISRPLIEAYRNLSDSGLPVVNVSPSNLIDSKYIPNELKIKKIFNIYGEDNLITEIKNIWMYLFDPQSLKLRIENGYEGFLSSSVYIQRMLRPEVSGEIHSKLKDNNLIVNAIYGIDDGSLDSDIECDKYVVSKSDNAIKEKTIVMQNFMLLRKGKTSETQRATISEKWQKEQKLDDDRILKLSELTERISEVLKKDIVVKFGIEAGIINIFYIKDIDLSSSSNVVEDFKSYVKTITNSVKNDNSQVKEYSSEELLENKYGSKLDSNLDKDKISDVSSNLSNIKEIDNVISELKSEKKEIIATQFNNEIVIGKLDLEANKKILEKKYISNFYLNASQMNSNSLKLLEEFDGAYIDFTTLLLKSQILPDSKISELAILNSLSESLKIQLNTASLKLGGNLITIRLSNVEKETLNLLGMRLDDIKYLNDERLIENDKALKFEIDIIKKLRLNHRFKNINIVLPDIRSLENASKLKKEIVGNNLRRSQSTKLILELNIPYSFLKLNKLSSSDWDGVLINLSEFTHNLFKKDNITECDLLDAINLISEYREQLIDKRIEFFMYINKSILEYSNLVNEIIKLYPNSFILEEKVDSKFLDLLEKQESKIFNRILKPLKKRGPKFKNLF